MNEQKILPQGMVKIEHSSFEGEAFFLHLPDTAVISQCSHCIFSHNRSSTHNCPTNDCTGGAFLKDEDELLRFKLFGKDALK